MSISVLLSPTGQKIAVEIVDSDQPFPRLELQLPLVCPETVVYEHRI